MAKLSGNVLVMGATGMLGRVLLAEARARGLAATGAARAGADEAVDLADEGSLRGLLDRLGPALVVNSAAITNIDLCAREPGQAWLVNARCVALMADWCRVNGARLVQISTEHYYSGDGARPHREDEPVVLLNDYARTKYAGEAFALCAPGALVARTNIVGFRRRAGEPAFVEWAVDALAGRKAMTLFADAYVSSLDVGACARAVFDLVQAGAAGILNVAAGAVFSKAEFVLALAARLGLPADHAVTGSVASLGTRRADSLGLDVGRAETLLGRRLPGLAEVVEALAQEYGSPCAGTA